MNICILSDYALPNVDDQYISNYSTCGQYNATRQGRVLGGTISKLGEMPFIALLGYANRRGKMEYNCAGTLISR